MRILGLDPGMASGLALWTPEVTSDASTALNVIVEGFSSLDLVVGGFSCLQIDCRSLSYYEEMLDAIVPDFIAYEGFRIRPNLKSPELYSIQVIAITRLWAEKERIQTIEYLPAAAKAFWTDDKIKRIGLWKPGQRHAMDALRVLLKYLGETNPAWFKDVVEKLRN